MKRPIEGIDHITTSQAQPSLPPWAERLNEQHGPRPCESRIGVKLPQVTALRFSVSCSPLSRHLYFYGSFDDSSKIYHSSVTGRQPGLIRHRGRAELPSFDSDCKVKSQVIFKKDTA